MRQPTGVSLRMPFLVVALLVFCSTGLSENLLVNPGFETPASGITPPTSVSFTNFCSAGISAAANWTIFVNSCTPGANDISTQLLPSTAPDGGSLMMHVTTDGAFNGIVQVFLPINTGPTEAEGSAWVFVNRGCVHIGTGNDGNTGPNAITCVTGQWIHLSAPNGVSPANEFIVYSNGGGADYFVDNASVVEIPEPSSLLLLGSGLLSLCGLLRRRAAR